MPSIPVFGTQIILTWHSNEKAIDYCWPAWFGIWTYIMHCILRFSKQCLYTVMQAMMFLHSSPLQKQPTVEYQVEKGK